MHTLLLIVIGIVALVLWLRWNEPRMLYYPLRQIDQTPDQLGLKYDDVYLTTSDGVKINGWFLPARGVVAPVLGAPGTNAAGTATTTPALLTVLFLHGNAGNISHRFEKLEILRSLGVDVFIIDYRGYGRSEGTPNEEGTYRDAQAAYEHLVGRAQPPGAPHFDPGSIIVYGESLGAAVAADFTSKHPVGGLILEEAFTSTGDVGQKMFPFLPVRRLVRNKYDTLSKMPRIKAPLLILHSRDDDLIPFRHGERLFATANDPKQFVELRGGHNDAFLTSAETYHNGLRDFFARCKTPITAALPDKTSLSDSQHRDP